MNVLKRKEMEGERIGGKETTDCSKFATGNTCNVLSRLEICISVSWKKFTLWHSGKGTTIADTADEGELQSGQKQTPCCDKNKKYRLYLYLCISLLTCLCAESGGQAGYLENLLHPHSRKPLHQVTQRGFLLSFLESFHHSPRKHHF